MTAWGKLQVRLAQYCGRQTMSEMLDLVRSVAMEEREACAKVADDFKAQGDWNAETAECIAASIRGRTEQ